MSLAHRDLLISAITLNSAQPLKLCTMAAVCTVSPVVLQCSAAPAVRSSFLGSAQTKAFSGQTLRLAVPSTISKRAPFRVFAETKKAVAVLKGTAGVEGVVQLVQEDNGPTKVSVKISGLSPGQHAFHLHQFGDTTNGCMSTGPHFNPKGLTHGAPGDEVRHAGDLGNILAGGDGVAEVELVDSQIPLSGADSVVGRAFVIHEGTDDLGKGGHELSPTTGNAGGRLACGVVGLTPLS